jgi:hypothetical protein
MGRVKFHLMMIDRTHARLMSALKTLATVRRLAVTAVQIIAAAPYQPEAPARRSPRTLAGASG